MQGFKSDPRLPCRGWGFSRRLQKMRRCLLDGASPLPAEGRELRVSLQKQSRPGVVQDCSGLRGMAGLTAVPGQSRCQHRGPR